jgi:hypothetical protein
MAALFCSMATSGNGSMAAMLSCKNVPCVPRATTAVFQSRLVPAQLVIKARCHSLSCLATIQCQPGLLCIAGHLAPAVSQDNLMCGWY